MSLHRQLLFSRRRQSAPLTQDSSLTTFIFLLRSTTFSTCNFGPHLIMADEKYGAEQREYAPPMQEKTSVGRYFATRVTTLKPAMAKVQNPIALLRLLNLQQWMFFLVAFFAWSWDAFDFFTVSLTVEDLAESFGKSKKGKSERT